MRRLACINTRCANIPCLYWSVFTLTDYTLYLDSYTTIYELLVSSNASAQQNVQITLAAGAASYLRAKRTENKTMHHVKLKNLLPYLNKAGSRGTPRQLECVEPQQACCRTTSG